MFELFIALVNHLGVKSTSSPRGSPFLRRGLYSLTPAEA
jgi:hypothetical protein